MAPEAEETIEAPPLDWDLRPLAPHEHEPVLAWLDTGLRDGRKGRLAAEYPTLLDPAGRAWHRVAWVGDLPAAHAVGREVTVRVDGVSLPIGMIGLVYTDPRFRRRGLASACVEACSQDLAEAGAAVALLWSDRHGFYRRMGFVPAGRELLVRVDARVSRIACERFPTAAHDEVGAPRAGDWPAIEPLVEQHRSHAIRRPGDLARLAASPDCTLRVARRGGRAVSYAACGRGDDFPGVVHEWAGETAGVAACIDSFVRERGDLLVLCGAAAPEPITTFRAAGAAAFPGALALCRLLDPTQLWRSVVADEPDLAPLGVGGSAEAPWIEAAGARASLDPPDVLALALGPEIPGAVRKALPQRWHAPLARILPRPAFLWGFDSI